MSKFRALLVICFALALAPAVAHGDPPDAGAATVSAAAAIAPAPAQPVGDPMTIAIVVSAIGLLSAFIRRVAPAAHWLHNPEGMFALAVLGAVLGAASQSIQMHGFAWQVVAVAAIGAASAAVAAYNPSAGAIASDVQPLLARHQGGFARLRFLVAIVGLGALGILPGCPGCTQTTTSQVEQVAGVCGEPAIAKLVEQVLPEVVLDLASQQWAKVLTDLVATLEQQGVQDAMTVVTCAVENIHFNARAAMRYAASADVHDHAALWIAVHPLPAQRVDGGAK